VFLTNELEGVILLEETSWRWKPRINFASFFSYTVGIDRRRVLSRKWILWEVCY